MFSVNQSLYQEAVSARRQSHKDCIRALEEYSTIQAFIPVILESVQDITSVVKTADAEARAQWRQFDNVDKIRSSKNRVVVIKCQMCVKKTILDTK